MKTIDGDKLIEKVTGRLLQDIIDEDGLDEFKRIEEEKAALEALAALENRDIEM